MQYTVYRAFEGLPIAFFFCSSTVCKQSAKTPPKRHLNGKCSRSNSNV